MAAATGLTAGASCLIATQHWHLETGRVEAADLASLKRCRVTIPSTVRERRQPGVRGELFLFHPVRPTPWLAKCEIGEPSLLPERSDTPDSLPASATVLPPANTVHPFGHLRPRPGDKNLPPFRAGQVPEPHLPDRASVIDCRDRPPGHVGKTFGSYSLNGPGKSERVAVTQH